MNYAQLFEAGMLVCFGFSWPINVVKAYKVRTAKDIQNKINKDKPVLNLSREEFYEETVCKNYTHSSNYYIEENSVFLLGGTADKQIPVADLAENFNFNFPIYNKSTNNLSVTAAKDFFKKNIMQFNPEAVLFHIGEQDLNLFSSNSEMFDNCYLSLIESIKNNNKKVRIALISVNNPAKNKIVESMNSHIKAIADSEQCTFINLDDAKVKHEKTRLPDKSE